MKTIIMDNRKFTKTSGKPYHYNSTLRKHLHQYIWEKHNGTIPKGYQVHHINHNPDDNRIENLQLMTTEEHVKHHIEHKRQNNLFSSPSQNALDAAAKWHKSEAGSEWHKKHYERMKDALYERVEKECKECGTTFMGTKGNSNLFCSNNCKSKWRRKSGLDDEVRICKCCGKEFTTNKYSKAKTCSRSCGSKLARKQVKR